MGKPLHPCISCGACCASFRVAFYWREAEPQDNKNCIPANLFVDLDDQQRCMKGTEIKHRPKCMALKGKIGSHAFCTIYPNRPTPCRTFAASFEVQKLNPRCDEARLAHGLKPLRRIDWEIYRNSFEEQENLDGKTRR